MPETITFDNSFPEQRPRVAAALGVFDGVHSGHRQILLNLREMAQKLHAIPVAITFFPHPRSILCPDDPPQLLLPEEERIRLLKETGAEYVGIINFSRTFAAKSPEKFLESLRLSPQFDLRGICVGSCWRFGHFGRGDKNTIAAFAEKYGIDFCPCPELHLKNETVSSSAIRRHTASGNLGTAAEMLGRPTRIFGEVESGNGIASTELETPTANLLPEYGVVPPDGVYCAAVPVDGKLYPAAVNIGFAPTYKVKKRRIEVHLAGFSGNLYGRKLEVFLFKKLRDEICFSSPEELKKQIQMDIGNILSVFESNREFCK